MLTVVLIDVYCILTLVMVGSSDKVSMTEAVWLSSLDSYLG